MEKNQLTEKILTLTLEIIYLLTGEHYGPLEKEAKNPVELNNDPLVSSGYGRGQSFKIQPSSLTPENKDKKILDVTQKMIELMTGEVPIRCQDVSVYFSMEEWDYLEGHKDLYKDIVMMEDQPPLTSLDGSSNSNPPERYPRPLNSQDSIQKDHITPHQGEEQMHMKMEIKEEEEEMGYRNTTEELGKVKIKMEEPSLYTCTDVFSNKNPPERGPNSSKSSTQDDHTYSLLNQDGNCSNFIIKIKEEIKVEERSFFENPIMEDQPPLTSPDGSSKGDPPERCPCPLDSTKEHQEIPLQCEREDPIGIKYEPVDDEEMYMRIDEPCKEEEVLPEIITDGQYRVGTLEENIIITPLYIIKDVDVNMSSNLHSGLLDGRLTSVTHSVSSQQPPGALCASTLGESIAQPEDQIRVEMMDDGTRFFSCSECGKCFMEKSSVIKHRCKHTSEHPFTCTECGKWFIYASQLTRHQKTHTGERPYSCSECGKCFAEKSNADRHWRLHTGERPHQCPECGKCFKNKYHLLVHLRFHTDEKPYSCSVCGKSFKQKSDMVKHQKRHSGEKPYSCSVCGKSFFGQSGLIRHEITHMGQKPYSCSDCGKQFTQKSQLVIHERVHSGSKPFSCATCGKCFTDKGVLVRHEKIHSEKP